MKFPHKQLKGVTLVELLVVLMIIVVLAGITITVVNPNRQRARSRDGVLRNTIAGIAQAIESFHNIRGAYPANTTADTTEMTNYVTDGFTVTRVTAANGSGLRFSNPNIFVNGLPSNATVARGINYWTARAGGNTIPCLEALTNETPNTVWLAWAPGYGITTINSSCRTPEGFLELTT